MAKPKPFQAIDEASAGHVPDQLELVAVMAQDFAQSLDIEETLKRALERITGYVEAEGGALFLIEEGGETLRCHASVGATDITGLTLGSDHGIVGRSVRRNRGEIVRDVARDPGFDRAVDRQTGFTTRSILCAPMSVKDDRIGAIELVNKRGGDGLFSHADLNFLSSLSTSAALAILNARMAARLVEQEKVRRELELAAEIQRSLLPERRGDDYPVHGVNYPARTVSGDFYDFFPIDGGRICFNLGDVSGKGMNAALLMAKTASLFRCLGKSIHRPGHLLARVNAEICETVTRGMFVTMLGGVYDPATGRVCLANAGHEPPLVEDAFGAFTRIPAEAPPLGLLPPAGEIEDFPEIEIDLDGGALYVFTDGVTEGYQENGTVLGVEGFQLGIARNRALAPPARLEAVLSAVHRRDQPLRDDLTALVIEDAAAKEARGRRTAPEAVAPAGGGETVVSIEVPSRPSRLRLVRAAIQEAARLAGFSDEGARDLVLAVDEACQNVIRHAYGGRPDGRLVVKVERECDRLAITVRDFAEAIDVSKVRPRELDDLRPGGLGTHLIQAVMDEVAFLPPPPGGGNLLRMVKRIG